MFKYKIICASRRAILYIPTTSALTLSHAIAIKKYYFTTELPFSSSNEQLKFLCIYAKVLPYDVTS